MNRQRRKHKATAQSWKGEGEVFAVRSCDTRWVQELSYMGLRLFSLSAQQGEGEKMNTGYYMPGTELDILNNRNNS